jgi:methionine sulfoxide reductase catalytic subunit
MLFKKPADIPSSEITPKETYFNRRKFLTGAVITGAAVATGLALRDLADPRLTAKASAKIDGIQKSPFSTTEKETPYKDVTNYNNFYEFSTDKYEPASLAKNFKTHPWKVTIEGLVKKKQELDVNGRSSSGRSNILFLEDRNTDVLSA